MTIKALFTVESASTVRGRILERLAAAQFPVTDWGDGGIARTLVEIMARENAEFSIQRVLVAQSAFLSTAEGDWLDVTAREVYGLTRYPATFALGDVVLTCSATAGPYTITPGQLWVGDAAGRRYTNTTGGVLPPGGTLTLQVRAESRGTWYNVDPGTITQMLVALPGVRCANPGVAAWASKPGVDAETDASLRERCTKQWATLGYGQNYDWYVYQCRNGHAHADVIDRVLVETAGDGRGEVAITLASKDGVVPPEQLDVIRAWLAPKLSQCITCTVGSADPLPVVVSATCYASAGSAAGIASDGEDRVRRLIRGVPIGGTLYVAAIVDALMGLGGVYNVKVTQPVADIKAPKRKVFAAQSVVITVG